MSLRLLVAVCLVVLPGQAFAHDFWLVPETHHTAKPGPLALKIWLGQPAEVTHFEPAPSQYKRWEAHGAAGKTTVRLGTGDNDATVELPAEDVYSIIYESRHNYVELEPDKFRAYLEKEGLFDIIEDRKRSNQDKLPGQEGFARYVKALVRVGNATAGFDRKIGMPAEIVALADPFAGGADGKLVFQLWYLGAPRENALMELFSIDETDFKIKSHGMVKTDKDGKFSFPSPGRGRWMVTGTVMRRAAYPVQADWESFWTSLSFQIESFAPPAPAVVLPAAADSTVPAASGSSWLPKVIVFVVVLFAIAVVGVLKLRKRRA
jgi:uncharacterized GH25 family protein